MIRDRETGVQKPAAESATGLWFVRLPVALLIGAGIGLAASLPVKPLYVADARIIVRVGSPFAAPGSIDTSGIVESEAAILVSRELALRVIDHHDLDRVLGPTDNRPLFATVLSLAGLNSGTGVNNPMDRALNR